MARVAIVVAIAVTVSGCAHMQTPPGGRFDTVPPMIVETNPEPDGINFKDKDVSITFDKVVNEQPRGVSNLSDLVLISPRHGDVEVRWRRQTLAIRPSQGWRANTAYSVRVSAGVTDLWGNIQQNDTTLVFSTGTQIPQGRVTGVLFDWEKGTPVTNGFIQLFLGNDSTVAYVAKTDADGRFVVTTVPPGRYRARGIMDNNRNFAADPGEALDTTTITLTDSTNIEFLAVVPDTVGPEIVSVNQRDSVTLVVSLSSLLNPEHPLSLSQFRLTAPDSSAVSLKDAIAGLITHPPLDSAETDSAAAPVLTDSAVATEKMKKPSKPLPYREITITVAKPLRPKTEYTLAASNLVGVTKVAAPSKQTFTTSEPRKTP